MIANIQIQITNVNIPETLAFLAINMLTPGRFILVIGTHNARNKIKNVIHQEQGHGFILVTKSMCVPTHI
jgi:hypothetical protein